MILITLILTNLIWVGYALTEGVREGFYWHYENNSRRVCDFDINPIFNLQRVLVMLITGGFMVHTLGWFSLLCLVCIFLMFNFFQQNCPHVYDQQVLRLDATWHRAQSLRRHLRPPDQDD